MRSMRFGLQARFLAAMAIMLAVVLALLGTLLHRQKVMQQEVADLGRDAMHSMVEDSLRRHGDFGNFFRRPTGGQMDRAHRARLAEQHDFVGAHTEDLASHFAGSIAAQVHDHGGNLAGFHFLELQDTRFFFRRVGGNGAGHGGPGKGRNAVGAHVETGHVERNGFRQANDTHFGSRVVGLTKVANQTGRGGHVNVGTGFLLAEMGRSGTADIEGTIQVNINDLRPFFVAHFVKQAVAQVTRIIHNDVDAAKIVNGGLNNFFSTFALGHTVGADNGFTARRTDFIDHFLAGLGADVVDDNLGARRGHGQCNAFSNTIACACDDGNFTLYDTAHGLDLLFFENMELIYEHRKP